MRIENSITSRKGGIATDIIHILRCDSHVCRKMEEARCSEIFREGLYYKSGWYGRPKDPEKAFTYFEWLSRLDYVPALLEVGLCYLEGRGVVKDLDESFHYFVCAKNQGSSVAADLLGDCFLNGTGVEIDVYEAMVQKTDCIQMVTNGDRFDFLSLYVK